MKYESRRHQICLRTENGALMDTPANLEIFLANLLASDIDEEPAPNIGVDDDGRAFVDNIWT